MWFSVRCRPSGAVPFSGSSYKDFAPTELAARTNLMAHRCAPATKKRLRRARSLELVEQETDQLRRSEIFIETAA
jgi:hypothetical protein